MRNHKAGFPPECRLTSGREFNRVFAKPMRSSDKYFTILARQGATDRPRLGLAISKRAAKQAVARNRLKRLARESFRLGGELPGYDFVVMAKPLAAEQPNAELKRSLERHFRRLASGRRD